MELPDRPSWAILDEALGHYRSAAAHAIHRERGTVDQWCLPQPAPTAADCNSTGRPNPLDLLDALLANSEHPEIIRAWLAERWGMRLLPVEAPAHGRLIAASPALLAAAVEQLCREVGARKPRLPAERLKSLRDEIIEAVAALTADALAKRGSK